MRKCVRLAVLLLVTVIAAGCGKDKEALDEFYDLTSMDGDMVYAAVFRMTADPESYEGKTIRIRGTYRQEYNQVTDLHRHFCMIQDAMACCAQGIEFVNSNGNGNISGEDPEDDEDIIVEGTFETYNREGDSRLYYRLKDASVDIAG